MSIIKKHTRNKDSHLDKGGVNESTAIDIRAHLDNTNNPHAVDKIDVGLGNVPNLDTTAAVNNEHLQNTDVALDQGQVNEVTAANLRIHLDDVTIHRVINDAGSSTTDLWSADKIGSEISGVSTALIIATEKTANFTAVKKELVPVDVATIPITVTPPATPVTGDIFAIVDSRFNAATNNITIDFTTATQNLYASLNNWIINEDGGYVEFIYISATIGWVARK